jgi:hypothetical protein
MRPWDTTLALCAALALAAPVLACGQDQKMSVESAKLEQQVQEQMPAEATDRNLDAQAIEDEVAFEDQLDE